MVQGLEIAPLGTHVAAVGFGNSAEVFFDLVKHQTVDNVLKGINEDIRYKVS